MIESKNTVLRGKGTEPSRDDTRLVDALVVVNALRAVGLASSLREGVGLVVGLEAG